MDIRTVNKINVSPFKAFFAIAGGGQSFIGDYTKIPGASQTVVGAIVPYDQSVLEEFIGEKVEKYVTSETARKLALASYNKCINAGVKPWNAIGIGATSSIVKDNERLGREHNFFVATHTFTQSSFFSLSLKQGRTRDQEDTVANNLIMLSLERATVNSNATISLTLNTGEKMDYRFARRPDYSSWPSLATSTGKRLVIYPGSWNPIHEGHRNIHCTAEIILGQTPYLEFSLTNTDKKSPDNFDLEKRVNGMAEFPYIITDAPTFKDKVAYLNQLYPNTEIVFIVGADVWKRIWMEKYAGPLSDLEKYFENNKVKFLVFGRGGQETRLGWGEDLKIISPEAEALKMDISSSEIRKKL